MLNTFVGGKLDGRVISTADLLNPGVGADILSYDWTKELVPTRTGEMARVWRDKNRLSEEVSQQVSTPAPPTQEDSQMAETVEFTSLETKRREAGISRQQLANQIGGALGTVSKVYRIERAGDDSKRTSEDERTAYVTALDVLVEQKRVKAEADAAAAAKAAEEKAAADAAKAAETPAPAADSNGTPADSAGGEEDPNAPAF